MKNTAAISIPLITSLFFITGCTTKLVSKEYMSGKANEGIVYRLPAKQFNIEVNYFFTDCIEHNSTLNLKADVLVSMSEQLIGDKAYVVDYESLNKPTKITETEFLLSEAGLFTGVNSSIKDQSAATIQNAAITAAGIAQAVSINPVLASSSILTPVSQKSNTTQLLESINALRSDTNSGALIDQALMRINQNDTSGIKATFKDTCAPIISLVTAYKKAVNNLKSEREKAAKISDMKSQISRVQTEIADSKGMASVYKAFAGAERQTAILNYLGEKHTQLKELQANLQKLESADVDGALKSLTSAQASLSLRGYDSFFPKPDKNTFIYQLPDSEKRRFFGKYVDSIDNVTLPKVIVDIHPIFEDPTSPSSAPPTGQVNGIAYRVPVPSTVSVIVENYQSMQEQILQRVTPIPQFGAIGTLGLTNRPFDENVIEVSFNSSTGAPSKLTFRAESKAEAASAAGRNVADTYLKLKKEQREDAIANQNALLQYRAEEVGLEKSISELKLAKIQTSALSATEQARVQEVLAESQLKLLRNQQRIDAVKTGAATSAEVELEALKTQEELLQQRIKILRLEQELALQKSEQGGAAD